MVIWVLIVANCLENKNPMSVNGISPLHLAVKNGHLKVIQFIMAVIVDKNPSVFDSGSSPLHLAANLGITTNLS